MPSRNVADPLRAAAIPAVGAGIAIGLMEGLAKLAGLPLGSLPFVTSIVLVMAAPKHVAAQPKAILAGHILSTLAGFLALYVLGSNDTSAAIAVGLAVLAMILAGALHPPAAINAFVVVTQSLGPRYFFLPVLPGAIILVCYAWGYHWLTLGSRWPVSQPPEDRRPRKDA